MNKKTNKSELIRAILAKNPAAKAPEIFALLKKDGVDVSLPLIYQTLRRNGSPKTTKAVKRGRKPGTSTAKVVASSSSVASPAPTNDLFASMQSFVSAAGSLDKAIDILSVFKK